MALTVTRSASTPWRLSYLITHNGAAGDTTTISAASLIDDASPDMAAFLGINWTGNNQANARKQLLGDNASGAYTTTPYCTVGVRPRTGLLAVDVDADVDGVTPTQNELNITTSSGGAGTVYLDVYFHHSLIR